MEAEKRGAEHPTQALFYKLGFACFVGSIVAGVVDDKHAALCIAAAIMSVGFFGLFTAIHLKH